MLFSKSRAVVKAQNDLKEGGSSKFGISPFGRKVATGAVGVAMGFSAVPVLTAPPITGEEAPAKKLDLTPAAEKEKQPEGKKAAPATKPAPKKEGTKVTFRHSHDKKTSVGNRVTFTVDADEVEATKNGVSVIVEHERVTGRGESTDPVFGVPVDERPVTTETTTTSVEKTIPVDKVKITPRVSYKRLKTSAPIIEPAEEGYGVPVGAQQSDKHGKISAGVSVDTNSFHGGVYSDSASASWNGSTGDVIISASASKQEKVFRVYPDSAANDSDKVKFVDSSVSATVPVGKSFAVGAQWDQSTTSIVGLNVSTTETSLSGLVFVPVSDDFAFEAFSGRGQRKRDFEHTALPLGFHDSTNFSVAGFKAVTFNCNPNFAGWLTYTGSNISWGGGLDFYVH